MSKDSPKTIYLRDYRVPDYLIDTVDLVFDLQEEASTVKSKIRCLSNYDRGEKIRPMVLNGKNLTLRSVVLDGRTLSVDDYKLDDDSLTIFDVPKDFILEIETEIKPQENTSLEGLYKSSGNFCTQCEAEGFRKITCFVDRPDVMAKYTTTIIAEKEKYPILLANGNLVEEGVLPEGRHFAKWHDPFPKPSYLFALVAGNLVKIEDTFTTMSGREIALQIYVEKHNHDKCDHAMQSLKKAMKWDEDVFGLEYDLDQYMIVAVDDFNMGAMENKGLNVFNSKYVLAKPETATDDDYEGIEAVIAHEYFHNWTGNRVTCRDWFQLSLKEGLTVFRDQQFSSDMISKGVKRIHDVNVLRNHQFPEDGGPMAHAVRPDSYIEINNFYTLTVYEKGSEIIRMIHALLGKELFRKGIDLYVERCDGHAATIEDFVGAMEDAAEVDLTQFRLWYSQAGTPKLNVSGSYSTGDKSYVLTVRQSCQASPGQTNKEPFHIPFAIGLLDGDGNDMSLQLKEGGRSSNENIHMLEIRKQEEVFHFINVPDAPVPSLLRDFSAPVKLHYEYSDAELRFLLANDSDPFNRWEAGQRLACRVLMGLVDDYQTGNTLKVEDEFAQVFAKILKDKDVEDKSFISQLLTLPSEMYLAEQMEVVDVEAIHKARQFVRKELASKLKDQFEDVYHYNMNREPYKYDPKLAGQRRLKNICLAYLMMLDDETIRKTCTKQYHEADNMTDSVNALRCLVHSECTEKAAALKDFADRWHDDPLVMDKWFTIQATAPLAETLEHVKQLMNHPAFSIKNPNKVRSLIGAFCGGNHICFHNESGEGYQFLADQVLALDAINGQIAARLAGRFSRWRRFNEHHQMLMRQQLERIRDSGKLSKDVYEVVTKSLN